MATLGFNFTIDGLDDETLVVREYQGHESVSDSFDWQEKPCFGYRYQIELASRRNDLTADQIVDNKGLLEIVRNGEVVQRVHGIIRCFTKGDTGHHHTFYSVTLVPSLERLSLRQNSRSFQQKTVPEILSTLLQEMNISDYSFAVQKACSKREYCVQYRESDLAFFHRLAAEEGLIYSFVHSKDKHQLVVTDNNDTFQTMEGEVPYNALSGGATDVMYVNQLTSHTQSEVSSVSMQDYSFKKPDYSFAQSAEADSADYQLSSYEHFDSPGRYKNDVAGKKFARVRLAYLRRLSETSTGKSNHCQLQSGVKFTLGDHLDSEMNREWLLVAVDHQGRQPQALEEAGGHGETTYANQFTVIPSDHIWQAVPQPKPQVDGPCIAIVKGPEGEEIYCDQYGRVKLHFPWDRYSNGDEHSSCWVRVSHDWAGAEYGIVAIPRIGHEVIVSFLHGDPDQPIVTGRTYHANNTPPYTLPENKTKTVLRTESHKGSGYNELSFEDQSGSEKISLHSQKDFEALIENDQINDIKHDQHLTVENERFSHIKANDHLTVNGEQRIKVSKNHSQDIGGSLEQKVSSLTAVQSGNAISLKSGAKIVVEGGAELTLKVGGSFVNLGGSGVSLVGPSINLNAGGSAGSGASYGGSAPTKPNVLQALDNPDEIEDLSSEASKTSNVSPLVRTGITTLDYADMVSKGQLTKEVCNCGKGGTCPIHG
ncbi:type VI secretion system Vgr family protein [Vibrio salinus]|uniref:type VI secretion system Vgr family protein n=1 Tax=Vibrio salinus TaxID=2899784 RepID=UPI001E55593A|nr:type VI secretion system tip protein TssI/VgrG [Vibrio salinus]MCE0495091.1 type VI secretion system tip protein VgrG [Vibrio salinus]